MSKPTSITIDDVQYIRADSVVQPLQPTGDIKIVVLPRGWNVTGHFSQEGSKCVLTNASVIRRWGTTKGLGQLALEGPLRETTLDKCPLTVEFHELSIILSITCVESVWKNKL